MKSNYFISPLQIFLWGLTLFKTCTGLNTGISAGKNHSAGFEHASSSSTYLLPSVFWWADIDGIS